jgi:hypothetical protein
LAVCFVAAMPVGREAKMHVRQRADVIAEHLVVRVQDSHVLHPTFLRYDRWPARIIWSVTAPIHQRVIRHVLERAE